MDGGGATVCAAPRGLTLKSGTLQASAGLKVISTRLLATPKIRHVVLAS
eukprot:COSAG02_NODE_50_length_44860_cov_203.992739_2_plen_49_part_00